VYVLDFHFKKSHIFEKKLLPLFFQVFFDAVQRAGNAEKQK